MKIKKDPISKLWCREDGAILMPRGGKKFTKFRWTFGSKHPTGYLKVVPHGEFYYVHQVVCRAFHGLPPENKPCVDHINRNKHDNRPENLHWVSHKENLANQDRVDESVERYGVRCCEDRNAYNRARYKASRDAFKGYEEEYNKVTKTGKAV